MGNAVPTPTSSGDSRAYKRSWRNLLINKQVQLRFTLFMVGLSAVLMILLGVWVKRVADSTTEVSLARVRGEVCPPLPEGEAPPARTPAAAPAPAAPEGEAPPVMSDPAVPTEVRDPEPASGAPAPAEGDRPRARVQIDETSMTLTPTPAAAEPAPATGELRAQVLAHWECEMRQAGLIRDLEARSRNIVWVLFGSGLFLCLGLAFFGIKMTHRVAGPLHKIGLYFAKMKDGRYGPVAPLRKGDELTELYEHFKAAAEGVRRAESEDVARMRAVLGAAKGADTSPELTKLLAELESAAQRKEKSLE